VFILFSQKKLKTAEFDTNKVLFTSIIRVGQYQNITGTIPVHIMILICRQILPLPIACPVLTLLFDLQNNKQYQLTFFINEATV